MKGMSEMPTEQCRVASIATRSNPHTITDKAPPRRLSLTLAAALTAKNVASSGSSFAR